MKRFNDTLSSMLKIFRIYPRAAFIRTLQSFRFWKADKLQMLSTPGKNVTPIPVKALPASRAIVPTKRAKPDPYQKKTVTPETKFNARTVTPEPKQNIKTVTPATKFVAKSVIPNAKTITPEPKFNAKIVTPEKPHHAKIVTPETKLNTKVVTPEAKVNAKIVPISQPLPQKRSSPTTIRKRKPKQAKKMKPSDDPIPEEPKDQSPPAKEMKPTRPLKHNEPSPSEKEKSQSSKIAAKKIYTEDIKKDTWCRYCRPSKCFPNERETIDHLIARHTRNNGLFCRICKKKVNKSAYRAHYRQSHVYSDWICECNKTLQNYTKYQQHVHKFHGAPNPQPYSEEDVKPISPLSTSPTSPMATLPEELEEDVQVAEAGKGFQRPHIEMVDEMNPNFKVAATQEDEVSSEGEYEIEFLPVPIQPDLQSDEQVEQEQPVREEKKTAVQIPKKQVEEEDSSSSESACEAKIEEEVSQKWACGEEFQMKYEFIRHKLYCNYVSGTS